MWCCLRDANLGVRTLKGIYTPIIYNMLHSFLYPIGCSSGKCRGCNEWSLKSFLKVEFCYPKCFPEVPGKQRRPCLAEHSKGSSLPPGTKGKGQSFPWERTNSLLPKGAREKLEPGKCAQSGLHRCSLSVATVTKCQKHGILKEHNSLSHSSVWSLRWLICFLQFRFWRPKSRCWLSGC